MTQQEKLSALFAEMNLPFEVYAQHGQQIIKLEAERGDEKVDGYTGMVCLFAFNEDGAFAKAAIAE